MAEIEIGVIAHQCLDRLIPDKAALYQKVIAWQECRNGDPVHVNSRFTTEDTRFKLKSLYPSIQTC